jgi:prepilin-type processing-associated H-X9-DG protein
MNAIDNSYQYTGFLMDRAEPEHPTSPVSILAPLILALGGDPPTGSDPVPTQLVGWLYALGSKVIAANPRATFDDLDLNTMFGDYRGNGTSGGAALVRLREGVERFLITDINNPAATARAQSEIWIMYDSLSTKAADYNHVPGGSNVLYMDGHVAFMRYSDTGRAPVNGGVARAVGGLSGAL